MKLTSNFLSIAAIIFCAVAALVAFFSPAVEKIEISHNSIEIEISSEFNLGLSCSPTKAELTDRVVWTTSNPEIATISNFGQVCGKAVGQATITAKYKNLTASCQVTILPIEVTGVSVSSQYSKIHPQETMQAQATITPQNATNQTLVWASSNPEVATVSSTGLITGVMAGQTTITATANNQICGSIDISVQNVIEVEDIDISSQTFNPTQLKIGSYQLKYTISPQNADNFVPTWESTDPSIISVDKNGKISTHKDGSATITATTPNGKKS
ncbi:MAG: Ig-like domain-containing protein, partial [Clostridia bacterium]|nr:Ig-like domain-containing protein [Clostridia bacterium]